MRFDPRKCFNKVAFPGDAGIPDLAPKMMPRLDAGPGEPPPLLPEGEPAGPIKEAPLTMDKVDVGDGFKRMIPLPNELKAIREAPGDVEPPTASKVVVDEPATSPSSLEQLLAALKGKYDVAKSTTGMGDLGMAGLGLGALGLGGYGAYKGYKALTGEDGEKKEKKKEKEAAIKFARELAVKASNGPNCYGNMNDKPQHGDKKKMPPFMKKKDNDNDKDNKPARATAKNVPVSVNIEKLVSMSKKSNHRTKLARDLGILTARAEHGY